MIKVDSSHKFPVCLGFGIIFALLNLGIVSTIVYGSEAIPDTLKKWRNELMKQPERRDYKVIYAESMISEDRNFVLTLAIQLKSGEPLVANVEKLFLHTGGFFSESWHQDVKLLDSSEGNVQLIIIRPGEVKWIKIVADISSEIQKNISSNYTWSSKLHLGKESIYLYNVKVDNISRLKKDEVTFGVDARTSSDSKLIDSKQENLQPVINGN